MRIVSSRDYNTTLLHQCQVKNMDVCIVAHFAYPALVEDVTGHIGGVEYQTTLLACWLAANGHRVSLVTWDEGQPPDCVISGVRVIKLCAKTDGLPGLRFFYPRWTRLNAALKAANADVYYQNGAEYVTGQVALWCQRNGKKFVYSVAALADCDSRLPLLPTMREKLLYRLGLRLADKVIVQTRAQLQMLQEEFACDSRVIPMPSAGPSAREFVDRNFPITDHQRVLWVGRISPEKQPDRFLALAQKCHDLQFDLIGPSLDSVYGQRVINNARQLPNVVVHGRATHKQLAEFYKRAVCLCCTSEHEGFPNVFLEAWSYGLPIVSAVDPDEIIARKGLGYVAHDIDEFARAIRQLLASPEQWRTMSRRARHYYLKNHHAESVMPQFEHALLQTVRKGQTDNRQARA